MEVGEELLVVCMHLHKRASPSTGPSVRNGFSRRGGQRFHTAVGNFIKLFSQSRLIYFISSSFAYQFW